MKEIMYSGMDSFDEKPKMIWVKGGYMVITPDQGSNDQWRSVNHKRSQNFSEYYCEPVDLSRFTDLTVVWERG